MGRDTGGPDQRAGRVGLSEHRKVITIRCLIPVYQAARRQLAGSGRRLHTPICGSVCISSPAAIAGYPGGAGPSAGSRRHIGWASLAIVKESEPCLLLVAFSL